MIDLESKSQEREIDGVVYRVWPVSFDKGRPALVRLIGVLSPVLAAALKAHTKEDQAAAVFESLPAVLSDADLAYFAKLFGDAARYKTDKGEWAPLIEKVQAEHFADRYLGYFKWIVFCCEVNFSSFFGGIRSGGAADGLLRMVTPK